MKPATITVANLGMGNLASVVRALERAAHEEGLSARCSVSDDHQAWRAGDVLVLPGQGGFRDAGLALADERGDTVRRWIDDGRPYFGICLGLQALFESSEEAPGVLGLGVFKGAVRRIATPLEAKGAAVKIPHMGWNAVEVLEHAPGPIRSLASSGETSAAYVYFVHSFHAVPEDSKLIVATAHLGPFPIAAAVAQGSVIATQFHPEKSQDAGIGVLRCFLREQLG